MYISVYCEVMTLLQGHKGITDGFFGPRFWLSYVQAQIRGIVTRRNTYFRW